MAAFLPKSFMDLATASTSVNSEVNIMGRVTDFMPPSQTRGTDWMCTFSITDTSLGANDDNDTGVGLKIRFFRPIQDELPSIQSSGDVVLLRSVKIKEYQGMNMGLSSRATSWAVFDGATIPEQRPANALNIKNAKSRQAPQVTHSEALYAVDLCNLRDRNLEEKYAFPSPAQKASASSFGPSTASTPSMKISSSASGSRTSFGGRDKFSLIKDLYVDTFYDLVGQVVKIYPNMGRLEMYVSDYTSNNMLYLYEWDKPQNDNGQYGDEFGYLPKSDRPQKWPGPFGQMTIMVTLWPPHSHFAQSQVKEGDFVVLQNIRAKLDRDGKMEAAMNGDRWHPSKINVKLISDHSDERVKDVLRRKRDYAERFKVQSAQYIDQVKFQKGEGKPLSKGQKRKKQKLDKEKAKLKKFENSAKKRKLDNHQYHYHDESVPLALTKSSKPTLNKNIHCSHPSIPPRPLSSILSLDTHETTTPSGITYTLPFQNIKCRATVRVIDFFPSDLAKFAVLLPERSEFDALSDYEPSDTDSESLPPDSPRHSSTMSDDEKERRWEWRFGLVLEDAEEKVAKGEERAKMTVYVAEQDAEFLLKLDAENLRTNDQALATLREKLFLLWGDLEERKTAERNMQELQADDSQGANPNGIQESNKGPPKSQSFQCCFQEYGIRAPKKSRKERQDSEDGDVKMEDAGKEEEVQWERRWRMFGTTIV